jgi:hypothetical protein
MLNRSMDARRRAHGMLWGSCQIGEDGALFMRFFLVPTDRKSSVSIRPSDARSFATASDDLEYPTISSGAPYWVGPSVSSLHLVPYADECHWHSGLSRPGAVPIELPFSIQESGKVGASSVPNRHRW